MKPDHYTAEQIIKILEQAEKGEQTSLQSAARMDTFYRWRKVSGGVSVNEFQCLRKLEKENAGSGGCSLNAIWKSTRSNSCSQKL